MQMARECAFAVMRGLMPHPGRAVKGRLGYACAMNRLLAGLAALLLLAAPAAAGVDKPAVERAFQAWIAGDLARQAAATGIAPSIYAKALAGVTLDWRLPELVPPGAPPAGAPEHQAEFRAPALYFNEAGLSSSAKRGQALAAQWKPTLAAIEKRSGVPGSILIALWARESAFGAEALPYSAIRSLATEAFIGARREMFLKELLAALRIVQAGDISADAMKSSWAGALGQPQFMPSLYLRYAVDFDGDGRRDIWGSVPDTLASMANYLKSEGWDRRRSPARWRGPTRAGP
jgi:lytic murein transglycosylase